MLAQLFVGSISGNTVRIGVDIASGTWGDATLRAVALAAFFCSIVAGAALPGSMRGTPLLVEAVLLGAFVLAGYIFGLREIKDPLPALPWAAFLVFAMALQNAVLRREHGEGVRGTTFITSLLAQSAVALVDVIRAKVAGQDAGPEHAHELRRNGIMFAAFLIGGILGALAYFRMSFSSLWPAAAFLVVLGIVDIRTPAPEGDES